MINAPDTTLPSRPAVPEKAIDDRRRFLGAACGVPLGRSLFHSHAFGELVLLFPVLDVLYAISG